MKNFLAVLTLCVCFVATGCLMGSWLQETVWCLPLWAAIISAAALSLGVLSTED